MSRSRDTPAASGHQPKRSILLENRYIQQFRTYYLPFRSPHMISCAPANPRASETTSRARVVGSCLALTSPVFKSGAAMGITPLFRISSLSSDVPDTISEPDFE